MNNPKKIVIISGANSELARPFISHFSQQINTKILALFRSNEIERTPSIIPLQCDLLKEESKEKIFNALTEI